MRRMAGLLMALVLAMGMAGPLWADANTALTLFSEAAIVVSAETGQVLYEKNIQGRLYPASITKILTVAMALEKAGRNLSEEIALTEEAIFSKQYMDRSSTHIALDVDEVITVEQAVYATMVESANDAANALGVYVSGNLSDFVAAMNEKLVEIGAVNTHFENPNGLHHDNHYTTAYDMALITRYALSVDGMRQAFAAYEYTIPPTNKQPETRYIGTDHMMFVNSYYTYDGAWGGKLGWTQNAKHTAVTLAKRGEMELICVVMRSTGQYDKYKDSAALFDQVFDNYKIQRVPAQAFEDRTVPVMSDGAMAATVTITRDQNIRAVVPSEVGDGDFTVTYHLPERYDDAASVLPTATVSYQLGQVSREIGAFPLTYTLTAAASAPEEEEPDKPFSGVIRAVIWVAGVLAGLFLLMLTIRVYNLSRRRKRKRLREQMLREQRRRESRRY